MKNESIQKAIDYFGGSQVELARALNVSKSQVWQWLNSKNSISLEKTIMLEEKTNGFIRCEDLHPDIHWFVLRSKNASLSINYKE